MIIGDAVKVFSSISEYDGQTGRILHIASNPFAPAPFVVQFGDAITDCFSERDLVTMSPIQPEWLETLHSPHGASQRARGYIGSASERRRIVHGIGSPCVQCGKLSCSHR